MRKRASPSPKANVTSPLCAPSRAGLLSGRYNQRVGVENNSQPGIAPEVPLFPAVFSSAGYATALLGKWHPGANQPGLRPSDRGFDEFYGYYTPFLNYHKPRLFRSGTAVTETDYSTDVFAREAEQFIERHRDRPFFLDVAFNAPHILSVHGKWRQKLKPDGRLEPNAPGEAKALTAPPGEADKYLAEAEGDYARADAVATIVALDAAVGRILDKLRDAGLERRTIVVFISDNGGHPENRSENLPLREFKWSVLEGGIRVPFLMANPGVLPAGLRYDRPVISSVLLPTCTALAGVIPQPGLDGTDVTPFLTGRNAGPPHEALFWRIDERHAVRAGQWKLIMQRRQAPLLFDLAADADEKTDVAAAHPELVADLKIRWEAWAATLPPVPAPRPRPSSITPIEPRAWRRLTGCHSCTTGPTNPAAFAPLVRLHDLGRWSRPCDREQGARPGSFASRRLNARGFAGLPYVVAFDTGTALAAAKRELRFGPLGTAPWEQ